MSSMNTTEHIVLKTTGNPVQIYTDGSSFPNPGFGGSASVAISNSKVIGIMTSQEVDSTNNRMEIQGLILAYLQMQKLEIPCEVIVYTDSIYAIKGLTEWRKSWEASGFKTSSKADVKNCDLWQTLYKLADECKHKVTHQWVKGHAFDRGNILVDEVASMARKHIGVNFDSYFTKFDSSFTL